MKEIAKKYKKSDEAEVKAEMYSIYKEIKDLYRDQAGYNPSGNIFCVSQNQMEWLMTNEIHMFDEDENDALPSAKAQIIATSVKVSKVQSEYLLKNDIVRFQFLEYLLRCAIKKYFESGVCETELDAVKMMIENHIRRHIKSQFD